MSDRLAPKLLAEFIGTFSFVFIGDPTCSRTLSVVRAPRRWSATVWGCPVSLRLP